MRSKIFKPLTFILVIVCIGIISSIATSEENQSQGREELYRNISLFSDGFALVENDYVDDVDSKDMVYGALKGMLSSLDPHS
ncbi:MAG: peptidase S41, partial [Candidatus Omnitrophica bacterium]|nr:peptidase S41 [Candidatus Omnitrophota bacterium]